MTDFKELEGKTLVRVEQEQGYEDVIVFETTDGEVYKQLHYQDCCEGVGIESIVGDLQDLVGTPILLAEEATEDDPEASECGMWTFYKLRTIKGSVDIRWYGSSNGYYSVSVDFTKV